MGTRAVQSQCPIGISKLLVVGLLSHQIVPEELLATNARVRERSCYGPRHPHNPGQDQRVSTIFAASVDARHMLPMDP